jgi:acylphosphatase
VNARAHVVVRGRVQGVWFRASCRDEGERLGLAGWVRNCEDGSVEAAAEGPREALEEWVAWCRRGPPAARVTAVDLTWEAPRGEAGFRVTG